jgi:hypothetical protein
MELFRKYRFVTVSVVLAAFLIFSGYSAPLLQIKGTKASDEKIRLTLAHASSVEYILPELSRAQNTPVLPVFKCFPDRVSFTGTQKILPESKSLTAPGPVPNPRQSILLEQICKFQI